MKYLKQLSWLILISTYSFAHTGYCDDNKSRTIIFEINPVSSPPPISTDIALSTTLATAVKLNITSQSVSPDSPPRQRNPEMSEDQLAIVGLDKNGSEIMRTLILDPRFVRSESVDEEGRIIATQLIQNKASFTVTLPNDERLTTIKIYHPQWDGQQYALQFQGQSNIK